ncbi:polymer-forming cytoskeletal protein [Methylophilaceae bacterium]|nr:polymer-forming cytoskeletal protein [Methylophilaceae bacterium]MDC1173157.1 polymer-forming cytoskeletal protein [Methylophilaceae bacterium]|tara:strand:- start:12971 stop:13375 length:405 start_codon:yes stop_codon:yes gene_type:complete
MLFKKKNKFNIDTLINEDFVIKGDTTYVGGIRLDGKIIGNVNVLGGNNGTLIMGEGSEVRGDIIVHNAIIGGKVTGNIRALNYIEIHPKADISGDIEYKVLEVHAGAKVQGVLKMMSTSAIKQYAKEIDVKTEK